MDDGKDGIDLSKEEIACMLNPERRKEFHTEHKDFHTGMKAFIKERLEKDKNPEAKTNYAPHWDDYDETHIYEDDWLQEFRK